MEVLRRLVPLVEVLSALGLSHADYDVWASRSLDVASYVHPAGHTLVDPVVVLGAMTGEAAA